MKELKPNTLCENCGDLATQLSGRRDETALCDDCAKGYEEHGDKTGYCGLYCQCTGQCDQSC